MTAMLRRAGGREPGKLRRRFEGVGSRRNGNLPRRRSSGARRGNYGIDVAVVMSVPPGVTAHAWIPAAPARASSAALDRHLRHSAARARGGRAVHDPGAQAARVRGAARARGRVALSQVFPVGRLAGELSVPARR